MVQSVEEGYASFMIRGLEGSENAICLLKLKHYVLAVGALYEDAGVLGYKALKENIVSYVQLGEGY